MVTSAHATLRNQSLFEVRDHIHVAGTRQNPLCQDGFLAAPRRCWFEAIRELADRKAKGKVVVTVDDG